jgi:hypothetical protein
VGDNLVQGQGGKAPPVDPTGYEGMAQGPHGTTQGFQGVARGAAMTPGEGIARSDAGGMDPAMAHLKSIIATALQALLSAHGGPAQ